MSLHEEHKPRDLLAQDELLQKLRQNVFEKRKQIDDAKLRLTHLSEQLVELERQQSKRQKLLKHQADAAFDWLQPCPWDSLLEQTSANVFGISSFRPSQHEALNATLMKRDVFAILPTGAGKSLIYQLAAVVDGGLTLVVSPLISLSMDQRAALKNCNINAECLHSELNKKKQKAIYDFFLPPAAFNKTSKHPRKHKRSTDEWVPDDVQPMVLFVTPEQVVRSKRLLSRLEKMHESGHLSRICVDEAHCCSSWGHDFRPEYRKLGILKRQCPSTPIIALTATSNSRTVEDVCSILEIPHAVIFRSGVNRSNLFYEVRPKADTDPAVIADITTWIRTDFRDQCGIIYVLSRKDADRYATGLAEHGVNASCYHADMSISDRAEVHDMWSTGHLSIVVATIAFGLGIDNPHVRFIIHATMAASLEAYYQESGRAGRDGLPARCIVLHKPKDFGRMSAFVGDKGPVRLQKMYDMYKYASSRGLGSGTLCRREVIVNSFGEKMPKRTTEQCKSCCDLCESRLGLMVSRLQSIDVTDVAKEMLKMIWEFVQLYPGKKTTILQFANNCGKSGPRIGEQAKRRDKAMVSAMDVNTRVSIINEMVLCGALQEYHRHSSYAVNPYVTTGNVDAVLKKNVIEVAVWKKNDVHSLWPKAKRRRTSPKYDEDCQVIMIVDSDEDLSGHPKQDAKEENKVDENLRATSDNNERESRSEQNGSLQK
ncbi:unnamed protein product [Agarophyton chilense]|eukprot:gb/GEZJ01002499.1/.p1 GENE.gb/GEZJ01002499.1/~~gb/GEZJ01002499.1/.p1  ORF type:complete len:711 (-),score=90.69 gb/GEZJ01002499.1/:228-2360(-)